MESTHGLFRLDRVGFPATTARLSTRPRCDETARRQLTQTAPPANRYPQAHNWLMLSMIRSIQISMFETCEANSISPPLFCPSPVRSLAEGTQNPMTASSGIRVDLF